MVYKLDDKGRVAAKEYVKKWKDIAFKTGVMSEDERKQVHKSVRDLYLASDLNPPKNIVIVPSPFVAAFSAGISSYILKKGSATLSATLSATESATRSATDLATDSATLSATDSATRSATDLATCLATHSSTYLATRSTTLSATELATDSATRSATLSATRSATESATRSATDSSTHSSTYLATYLATDSSTYLATYSATHLATLSTTYSSTYSSTRLATLSATYSKDSFYIGHEGCIQAALDIIGLDNFNFIKNSYYMYQGGSMWSSSMCFIDFGRNYIGLDLDYSKYEPWEELGKISGFRYMHEDFCIVSDRPVKLELDDLGRPHCEDGPYIEWSDGSGIFAWRGVLVPAGWILERDKLTIGEVLKRENVEERLAGIQIIGWDKALDDLKHRIVDSDINPDHGELIEVWLDGIDESCYYLKALCPRNGWIFEGVPKVSDIDSSSINTVRGAQAWRIGMVESEFEYPEFRT